MAAAAGQGDRVKKSRRSALVASALGSAALLLWAAPSLAAGGSTDFGDAPDGAKAGVGKKPKAIGSFPSKAATPGPRHSSIGSFFLGRSVDGETDSEQVDKDPFDDGAEATLSSCGASTLEVALNGTALPAATRTSAHTAYVNAWFDWNGDGDWADASDGCRAEWAIQNLPVDMSALSADGVTLLPIGFIAGKRTKEIWFRVTLTLDEPVVSPISRGPAIPYVQGETEDYFIGTPGPPIFDGGDDDGGGGGGGGKKGKFKVSCIPNPALIFHGGSAKVKFGIADTGKGHIFGVVDGKPSAKTGKFKLIPKKPQPKGVPPGFKAMEGFSFKSSQVDPPIRIQKASFKFSFRRGNQSQKLTCVIYIIHISIQLPKFFCVVPAGCAGDVAPRPPVHPTGLSGSQWVPVPIEIVQLSLQSAQPVTGFKLPLLPQTPPWTTAKLLGSNDGSVNCKLGTVRPDGGPAALVCTRQNTPVNNTYQIQIGAQPPTQPGLPLNGEVTLAGQEFSFAIPQP